MAVPVAVRLPPVLQVVLETRVRLAIRGLPVTLGQELLQALRATLELMAIPVIQEALVRAETRVVPVMREPTETRVRRVTLALVEGRVVPVVQGPTETRVRQVIPVLAAEVVVLVIPDRRLIPKTLRRRLRCVIRIPLPLRLLGK